MRFQNTVRFTTFKSPFSEKKKVSAVLTLFRTVGIRLSCKCEPSVLFYSIRRAKKAGVFNSESAGDSNFALF